VRSFLGPLKYKQTQNKIWPQAIAVKHNLNYQLNLIAVKYKLNLTKSNLTRFDKISVELR